MTISPSRSLAALVATSLLVILGPTSWSSLARAGTPDALTVDTTKDSFDGSCDDGDCSLRDAVKSAPAGARVLVPPGFYTLSITGRGGVGVGPIELRRRVRIAGDGDTGAFIDATDLRGPAFVTSPIGDRVRLALTNLTVFGSREGTHRGGAIRVSGGTLRLRGITITGGFAERGGGIAVGADGTLALRDTLVLGNEAVTGGGIWNEGDVSVARSAVVGNLAVDGAGFAADRGSTTSILDSTIAENAAADAGGGLWIAGSGELRATTIGDNEATRGGGISIEGDATGSVTLDSSIVAGNRATSSRQCAGTVASSGDNIEQGHRCGLHRQSDLEDTDPMVRRLGPNGGPTPTMALSVRSPAVGLAGDCGGRDQRGAPRDRRCDAGAYEIVRCLGKPVNIVGTPGRDELSGGRGRDVFLGMGAADEFQGSIGKDRACGGAGTDLLIAGPGRDRFDGEAGNDRVKGESGNDVVFGGRGRDRLVGGPGADSCEADVRDRAARGCEVVLGGAARPAT